MSSNETSNHILSYSIILCRIIYYYIITLLCYHTLSWVRCTIWRMIHHHISNKNFPCGGLLQIKCTRDITFKALQGCSESKISDAPGSPRWAYRFPELIGPQFGLSGPQLSPVGPFEVPVFIFLSSVLLFFPSLSLSFSLSLSLSLPQIGHIG